MVHVFHLLEDIVVDVLGHMLLDSISHLDQENPTLAPISCENKYV